MVEGPYTLNTCKSGNVSYNSTAVSQLIPHLQVDHCAAALTLLHKTDAQITCTLLFQNLADPPHTSDKTLPFPQCLGKISHCGCAGFKVHGAVSHLTFSICDDFPDLSWLSRESQRTFRVLSGPLAPRPVKSVLDHARSSGKTLL